MECFWPTRWWFLKYFCMFTPKLGEDESNLTSIFFHNGLVQPPPSPGLRLHKGVWISFFGSNFFSSFFCGTSPRGPLPYIQNTWCERLEERHALVFFLTTHGVGWGCVHVPSTCTRWWCTRHECYATHGVVWGGAVFRFLQLAHAGDAHAMNATLLMGWCGWGCVHVPSTCTSWWCTRHECYATHGVVWGEAVFTFLQLAHAGDAHAMNATLLMGWCGVGQCSCSFNLHTLVMHTPWMLRYSWGGVGWLCSCSFNLHTRGMGLGLGLGWGGWCC